MNIRLSNILLAVSTVLVLSVSCGRDEARVIPRGRLARIYAEILMTDQWIGGKMNLRRMADTSLVYEPILESYGYTSDDYVKSVDVYMDDPERFAKILRSTVEILDRRLAALKEEKDRLAAEKEVEEYIRRFRVLLNIGKTFPYMGDEPYVHYYDSLSVEMDSITKTYRIIPLEKVEADSLGVADSLVVADTLMSDDTLSLADSVLAADTVAAADSQAMEERMVFDKVVKANSESIWQ